MIFGRTCKCPTYIEYVSSKWIGYLLFRSETVFGKCRSLQRWFGNQASLDGSYQTLSYSYNPSDVEHCVQEFWHNQQLNQSRIAVDHKNVETFSMILPPPNVTGTLHLGHSLTVTIQDVLSRWQRMQGKKVLWIPGFDHAGIATQTTFEKKLWKERRQTRYDLGRKEFERELWNWKKEKQSTIINQLKNMGASLDWSRQYFTLDSEHSETVLRAFIQLHSDGLIYRSKSIINWCCELQSAISDIEVDHLEIDGPTLLNIPNYERPIRFGILSNFAYKSQDGDHELVVSTTRLETMLGDTAVAVHPGDNRYVHWHGTHLWHPFLKKTIPVVCDESVDPHFGTGVVKITPAHSQTDYEIGKKHNLEFLSVIDEKGVMNELCGKFEGLKRFEAREKIKDELAKLNLLREEKSHAMSVPICSRTGDVIEFLLKPQWFLSCKEISKVAVAAVERGELKITPSSHINVWYTWLHNIRDWCLSRQLWWGHQIPAYECFYPDGGKSEWIVAECSERARDAALKKWNLQTEDRDKIIVEQDTDVLDTWFSSALLPFSTLGWPHQTDDLKDFYPLSVMETGHDILFFWVARMVMLGTCITGKLPFKKVVLHGMVCDSYGRKMSKSLGNVIDPQDVINGASAQSLLQNAHINYDLGLISDAELNRTLKSYETMFPDGIPECGSDALRFTLCSLNLSNPQVNFDVTSCFKNRLFGSKMWQACRYIQISYDSISSEGKTLECGPPSKFDQWIISRLAYLVCQVDQSLSSNTFHLAANALRRFIHDEFCSTYLEGTKPNIRACDSSSVRTMETLLLCLDVALQALSPFMPFITEYLYQHLPHRRNAAFNDTIALASYPSSHEWACSRNKQIEDEIHDVLSVVSGLRHLHSTYQITKKDCPQGYIECTSVESKTRYEEHLGLICTLAGVENVQVMDHVSENIKNEAVNVALSGRGYIYLKISKKKDESKEILEKMRRFRLALKNLEKLQKRTSHPDYSTSAPKEVQLKHKEKIASLEAEINDLKKYQELTEAKN